MDHNFFAMGAADERALGRGHLTDTIAARGRRTHEPPGLTFTTIQQVAIIAPCTFTSRAPGRGIVSNAGLQNAYSSFVSAPGIWRGFATDLDDRGSPFVWDEERRAVLRAELDAAFFRLCGVERDDVEYILDTFPNRPPQGEAKFGEFRTKRLMMEIYADLAEAAATGEPFVSRLDPPPGHGRRHPARNDHGH